jgi:transposase
MQKGCASELPWRARWPTAFICCKLRRAAQSSLTPFQRFAKGLRSDMAAVQAAGTLSWSQGPIKGQLHRLKMLKRQMFGRARLDLLTRRFLLAA